TQTAAHLAVTTDGLSQCDTAALYFAIGVYEHHTRGAIRAHCFSGYEDAGCQRRGPRGLRLQEGDAHAHVGHDTRVPLFDGDAHFDRGLTAVCRRDDGDHLSGDLPCRIGVQHSLHRLSRRDPIDERLVDVHLNFERVHVHDGTYTGAREAATS